MIAEMQRLAFKNVVSRHITMDKKNLQMEIQNFLTFITNNKGLTPNGPFFYTLLEESTDDSVLAILSIPINENFIEISQGDQLIFQTYFLIDQMIMKRTRMKDKSSIEEESKPIYDELSKYISNNKMETFSPYYHVVREMKNKVYLEIYIAASRTADSPGLFGLF